MTVGLAPAIANEVLDAIGNNGSAGTLTGLTEMWIQLHTGDPGAAGTSNIAGNATRKLVSFGAASGGVMSNDTAITWTSGEVDTSEDYTHWSGWSASSSGTFVGSGTVSANAVTSGDEFELPIGDVDLTLSVAA
jgi:hypothetical protein